MTSCWLSRHHCHSEKVSTLKGKNLLPLNRLEIGEKITVLSTPFRHPSESCYSFDVLF